ncbi:ATP-dependent Clp protease adapter ClpS [Microbacterium sp. NIBRBAC000506063]|uniref:ATP-dependent Clp protease adapter ClpS n=1 Tax=Microbacterium sp. NIBRBAC000506063 TaxID=2734618 RepID=UPI001BB733E4|nr:ATP-dependent Clp protease adapter ClpS [Microbacterium sp. NIBRBAC000506063]QTV80715.1 ATP-dependent Clp protease adapter ClpS [Microbacterium sp. NIBRBAC000506063]
MITPDVDQEIDLVAAPMEPWQVVVWNDPVNLMSYVVRVFRTYFGYTAERATQLMLQVHHEGHAIVATGPRETMEVHAQAMHDYGLWATIRKAPQ